ncbi:MAG: metallophosphoesterase family protein [Phycisphaerales bacterium]
MKPLPSAIASTLLITTSAGVMCVCLQGCATATRSAPPSEHTNVATDTDSPAIHDDDAPINTRRVIAGTAGRTLDMPPAAARGLRLAVLPDQTTGRDWGLRYLTLAVEDLNRLQPDAVISIGDMIQGYTRDPAQWDREADRFFQIIEPLAMPFFPLAGNHEVISGTRDRNDLTFHERYQQRFAPLYYALWFDEISAIICFSDDPTFAEGGEGIGPEQLTWLRTTLAQAAARNRPIIALMHRPLWRNSRSNWDRDIHPLCVEHGVDAVVAGHFHSLQRDPDRDGIEYHILGTCGGMIDQLPLAGQLQHLTFMHVDANGSLRTFHQPVGMTLPDDFVVREDQDRVFRLKTDTRVFTISDLKREPVAGEVSETLTLTFRNPIDVPIDVSVQLIDHVPGPELWQDSLWVSTVGRDRFNPHVTDTETPFTMHRESDDESRDGADAPLRIEPNATATMHVTLTSPQIALPRNPPELHARATFTDSKGRSVPVILRARVPMQREILLRDVEMATADSDASPLLQWWPACAWTFSVYETLEANPTLALSRDGNNLIIDIRVPDDRRSACADDPRSIAERLNDPMSDAIMIRVGRRGEERIWYVEPFLSDTLWSVDRNRSDARSVGSVDTTTSESGWTCRVVVNDVLGHAGQNEDVILINIGIADNDDTYHTQWRWLAPKHMPARLLRK